MLSLKQAPSVTKQIVAFLCFNMTFAEFLWKNCTSQCCRTTYVHSILLSAPVHNCYTAKERGGFGGSFEDSAKFDNPWRRDGPLPDLPESRDAPRRRFDGPSSDRPDRPISSVADGVDQWRSSRPQRISEGDAPPFRRKGSGFLTPEGQVGAADKEDVWTIGSKFKSSANGLSEDASGRPFRPRGDMPPPKETPGDDSDWRGSARQAKSVSGARNSISRKISCQRDNLLKLKSLLY